MSMLVPVSLSMLQTVFIRLDLKFWILRIGWGGGKGIYSNAMIRVGMY